MEQERVEQGLDENGMRERRMAVTPFGEYVQTVAIVRDKDGNPRFDDPDNVPEIILQSLTEKDLEYLNTLRND